MSEAARPHFLTHLGALLVGAVAFAATCYGVARVLPFPAVDAIAPKYRYFAEHRDEYDVLFLGSSRFYHQIIPAEFDAAVEKLTGRRPRSFNAAYDAVWPPESYYFLRRLLQLRPAKLRWVVIDSLDINPDLDDRNRFTRRQLYWHDWPHTRMAIESVLDDTGRAVPRTPAVRRDLVLDHLAIFIKRAINLGRGSELVTAGLLPLRRKAERKPDWHDAHGYFPGGREGMTGKARESYLIMVKRLSQGLPPITPNQPLWKAMSAIVDDVRRAGAEPIFAIAPTLNERENFASAPGGAAIIAFNDPNKYPRLFDPDLHYDAWHLNERGAHDFTQALAEQFAAVMAARKR